MSGISIYDAYIPTFFKILDTIDNILAKAQKHAKENGIDFDAEYTNAAIIDDMYPLTKQIMIATRGMKTTVFTATGLGQDWPAEEDKTLADLSARVQWTRELLKQLKPEQLNGRENEVMNFAFTNGPGPTWDGSLFTWLSCFMVPNIFFHLVTAYDILRKQGVPLGKGDYILAFKPQ